MLGEHEAASRESNSTNPTGYTPTPEEKKAIKLVNDVFEKNKTHRKRYDERWSDYYKMFRGKQWKDDRPSYRHSEVINMIFQNIQAAVPELTDSRPKIEFMPQEPGDMELASILNDVLTSDWERGNWLYKLTEVIYDKKIYGTGMGSVLEPLEPGARIRFQSEDLFYCFPDPDAVDVNEAQHGERANTFLFAEPVRLKKLKREYPDKAKYLKPDLMDSTLGEDRKDLTKPAYKTPTAADYVPGDGSSPTDSKKSDRLLKLTLYILDDEIEEEKREKLDDQGAPVIDPATGQPATEYVQRLKYPQGRKICVAGGVLLDDGPIPYDDGLFPFIRFPNYILPREYHGISDVEQLESPQKIFNKLVSFALDVLTLMGNPVWLNPTSSGVDSDNLFNRPGLTIDYDGERPPQRVEGVQLQPYVLQMIDRMKSWFDDISGNLEVSRGAKPEGVTAASAINSLQEAGKTRRRLEARNLDAGLQQFGQLYLSRVFQHYTAPMVFRLTGKDGANRYFKFHIDTAVDETGEPYKVAKVRNYNQHPETGAYAEAVDSKDYRILGEFDVRVATGSSLPFAKQEKANMAKEGIEVGALDGREWLDAVDYPNAEAVWTRVQERKQAEMAAKAQAQGAPPPGAPPEGAPPPPQ